MNNCPALLLCDFYKTVHSEQYPKNMTKIVSYFTPRIRMTTLYAIGQEMGYRVCGTGNASEAYVGYFTKWGDGAHDFNPIANFTTDEVVALGHALGLPSHLVDKTPSDGLCGKTDEDNLGFTYKELNAYLHGNEIIDKEIVEKIEKLHIYNLHKRDPIPRF